MQILLNIRIGYFLSFFFSSRRRHTRFDCDWSSDVCSSDLSCSFDREGRGLGHRAAALGAELRAPEDRGAALAAGGGARLPARDGGREQRVEIGRASCRERV